MCESVCVCVCVGVCVCVCVCMRAITVVLCFMQSDYSSSPSPARPRWKRTPQIPPVAKFEMLAPSRNHCVEERERL